MATAIPAAVEEYLDLIEHGKHRVCREQTALAAYIRHTFADETLIVDDAQLEKYLSLVKYWPYDGLMPWEKFLLALWNCTYKEDGAPRWSTVFFCAGRGTGKDGFIAYDAMCSVSPYNHVSNYNVDIVADNADQAARPLRDIGNVLDGISNTTLRKKLDRHFYHTQELVRGIKNHGEVRGHTRSPDAKNGLRSGKVIFNEIHLFQNYDRIRVMTSGLGKVAQPRRGFFTTNGYVSDGPLDDYLARADRILFEGENDHGFLPMVFRLDSSEEINDEANWYKANPSLAYFPHLLQEIRDEYEEWLIHPEEHGDLPTKRMNLRAGYKEVSVTDYEKVLITKQELPDLTGWSCIAGLDYAELNDWASVVLHFRQGEKRFDIHHSWLCLQSKTLPRIRAPWQDWAKLGMVTPVDDVSISPALLAQYLREAGLHFNIIMLAMDSYRWTLVSDSMREAGWDAADRERVKLVRPGDIMQIEPVIQTCFDRGYFCWGDCPPLRWAVNNTKRMKSAKKFGVDTGNYIYAKIEAKSRKTDPFMALVAAMTCEQKLGTGAPARAPMAAIAI